MGDQKVNSGWFCRAEDKGDYRDRQVNTRGCSKAFQVCLFYRALRTALQMHAKGENIQWPYSSAQITEWIMQALEDMSANPQWDDVYGSGTKFDRNDPSTFWHCTSNFKTWIKNNVERKKKYIALIVDGQSPGVYIDPALGTQSKNEKRLAFCRTMIRLVLNLQAFSSAFSSVRVNEPHKFYALPEPIPEYIRPLLASFRGEVLPLGHAIPMPRVEEDGTADVYGSVLGGGGGTVPSAKYKVKKIPASSKKKQEATPPPPPSILSRAMAAARGGGGAGAGRGSLCSENYSSSSTGALPMAASKKRQLSQMWDNDAFVYDTAGTRSNINVESVIEEASRRSSVIYYSHKDNSDVTIKELVVQDVEVGQGPGVQANDFVSVTLLGSYKTTHDSSVWIFHDKTLGDLQFEVSSGDVIKGLDQGILGMQRGGKRIIKVPNKLAYSARGNLPDIPGNMPLTLEVTLNAIYDRIIDHNDLELPSSFLEAS